jgi:hypothetical protein
MSIKVSKSFIRALVKELINSEMTAQDVKQSVKPFVKKIGVVHFKHYRQSGSIDLYTGRSEDKDMHDSYGSLCLFTNKSIGIVIKDNGDLFNNDDLIPALYGMLAHEIGHYINGDLNKKNEAEDFLLRATDVNTEKQVTVYDNGKAVDYLRTVIVSILKDGVIKNELAADLVAVELVGLPSVLMSKEYDDNNTTNLTVLIEKRNRINRLVSMVKNNTLKHREDSELTITINKQ